jgi:hypothetical protein
MNRWAVWISTVLVFALVGFLIVAGVRALAG